MTAGRMPVSEPAARQAIARQAQGHEMHVKDLRKQSGQETDHILGQYD